MRPSRGNSLCLMLMFLGHGRLAASAALDLRADSSPITSTSSSSSSTSSTFSTSSASSSSSSSTSSLSTSSSSTSSSSTSSSSSSTSSSSTSSSSSTCSSSSPGLTSSTSVGSVSNTLGTLVSTTSNTETPSILSLSNSITSQSSTASLDGLSTIVDSSPTVISELVVPLPSSITTSGESKTISKQSTVTSSEGTTTSAQNKLDQGISADEPSKTSSSKKSSSIHSTTSSTRGKQTSSSLEAELSLLSSYVNSHPNTTTLTTYTNDQVTITSAPNWGGQSIPINTCNYIAPEGDIEWNPCMVFAGTVQLSYFPEPTGTTTYPSLYYNPELGIVMTSPSIYMYINTLTASNSCGQLGPTYANFIVSFDLTEVYTLQPYADATTRDRMGDPRQLTLSDLVNNCPASDSSPASLITTMGAVIDEHPVNDAWNRCNPRISMPDRMVSVGLPYWRHCGNDNGQFGIYDPPGAVPPVGGLFTSAAPVTSTSVSATPGSTVVPAAGPTAQSAAPASTRAASTAPVVLSLPNAPTVLSLPVAATAIANSASADPAATNPGSTAPVVSPSTLVAVVGTNTIIPLPGSGAVLPDGSTATVGAVTTLTDSNNNAVVASVAASGVYLQAAGGGSATYIANPTAQSTPASTNVGVATPIATIAGHVVSAVPGASTIVIGAQTLSVGGKPITIAGSNDVALLGTAGLVVQYPSGIVSLFTIPTAVSTPALVPAVENLNGVPISAVSGSSVVAIGSQTVTLGGAAITLTDHAVVSLATQGLIVQRPSGVASTVPILLPYSGPNVMTPTPQASSTQSQAGIASIIASLVGIPAPAQTTGSASSSAGVASLVASIVGVYTTLEPPAVFTFSSTPPEVVNVTASATDGLTTPSVISVSSGTRTLLGMTWLRWIGSCILLAFAA